MTVKKSRLFLAAFLMDICCGLFLLVASLLAIRVISSPLILGLTGTIYIGTRIIGSFIFGGLSDRIGFKKLILISCCLSIISFLFLKLNGIGYIFFAYFINGLVNCMFWPSIEAWIGQETQNRNLLIHLGTFGLAITGGMTIGNLTGGIFMKFDPIYSISFGCLYSIIVGLLLFKVPNHPEFVQTSIAEQSFNLLNNSPDFKIPEQLSLKAKELYRFAGWSANFATWTAIGVMRFLFNKLCVQLGISTLIIGSINAVLYFCWFLMFLAMMHFKGWSYRLRPLITFQILGILAMLLMGLWPSKNLFFLACGIFGFSAGMTYFSSMFYGQNGAHDKGAKSGLHEMILALGMLIGPFIGGIVAEIFYLQTSFLFCALVILAAIVVEIKILHKQTKEKV